MHVYLSWPRWQRRCIRDSCIIPGRSALYSHVSVCSEQRRKGRWRDIEREDWSRSYNLYCLPSYGTLQEHRQDAFSYPARRPPRFERDRHGREGRADGVAAMRPHPFRRLVPEAVGPERIGHLFLGHDPWRGTHLHIPGRRERGASEGGEIEIRGPLLEAAPCRQDADLVEFIVSKSLQAPVHRLDIIGSGRSFRRLGLSQPLF